MGMINSLILTQTNFNWINDITGPFGALVLSVMGLYIFAKAIQYLVKLIINQNNERLAEKDRQIADLEQKIQNLISQK